jgi:hypothetical protein
MGRNSELNIDVQQNEKERMREEGGRYKQRGNCRL